VSAVEPSPKIARAQVDKEKTEEKIIPNLQRKSPKVDLHLRETPHLPIAINSNRALLIVIALQEHPV
jgi:hypothetical protein